MSHTENKKKNNKGIIILILLFIIGIVIGYFTYNKVSESRAEKARIEQIAAEKAREQQRKADSIALAQIESRKAEEAAQSQDSTSPRYKVVYGVYDLRSNVDVAIKRISKKYGAERGKEYSFGAKTLVSMFESENRAECQRFLMENYDLYPDAWIYDSKQ